MSERLDAALQRIGELENELREAKAQNVKDFNEWTRSRLELERDLAELESELRAWFGHSGIGPNPGRWPRMARIFARRYERLTYPKAPEMMEQLAREFHQVYQDEARRQAGQGADTVRHPDDYDSLPEHTKDYDRALAIWVLNRYA